MPALVAGIRVVTSLFPAAGHDVDGRNKPGHEDE
jgi:hypothetical protein